MTLLTQGSNDDVALVTVATTMYWRACRYRPGKQTRLASTIFLDGKKEKKSREKHAKKNKSTENGLQARASFLAEEA